MKIIEDVFNKLQKFVPIKNPKGHNKAFRLKEKGENTGIFYEIPEQIGNAMDNQIFNVPQENNQLNNRNINLNEGGEEIQELNGDGEHENGEEDSMDISRGN